MSGEQETISVWTGQEGILWFGVAHHGGRLVATAVGSDREEAAEAVRRCIPGGRAHRFDGGDAGYPREVAQMLARLEAGGEEEPRFELCPDCVSGPLSAVLRTAAAIPRGYAASYGGIARAAGTVARAVGRVMAGNPLYPIVACHRVVGSDMSLVGYGGRQDAAALRAKRKRLRAEAKGFREERTIDAAGGLVVFPVEWVLARTEGDEGQRSLW